jgi:hypothetical protein
VVGWGGGGQVHNVDYDPGPWRQTLSLPPPGNKPGSPASQAGTIPKELSRQLIQGSSDKYGILQIFDRNGTKQLKINFLFNVVNIILFFLQSS